MDTIEGLWQRIEDWMRLHAPQRWQQLAPGADEEEIKRLEHTIDIALPEEVRASYLRHDGGYIIELVSQMEIMSVEAIVGIWQLYRELLDYDDWAATPPVYFTEERLRFGWKPGPIQPVWWHPRWIPFGEDVCGNLCCLDMAPAPGGAAGQILDWDHETGPSRVLFPSFQQLLGAFADQLEGIPGTQDTWSMTTAEVRNFWQRFHAASRHGTDS